MAASQEYLDLLEGMRELHIAKAAGYSGSREDTWFNFREAELWGVTALKGCLVRLGDKYRRAQNLVLDENNDLLADETLEDTLMDLAAYALIAVCLLREQSPTPQVLESRVGKTLAKLGVVPE